jgi:hypothetical protein
MIVDVALLQFASALFSPPPVDVACSELFSFEFSSSPFFSFYLYPPMLDLINNNKNNHNDKLNKKIK